ncbi:MAG: Ig-like domain-containing protein, partial [Candidatus Cryptobacteroides sp.]
MKKFIVLLLLAVVFNGCSSTELFNLEERKTDAAALTLNHKKLENLITGESRRLVATFTPAEVSDRTVIWTSTDEEVVTVDPEGCLRATGLGEAKIIVTSPTFKSVSDSCDVSVTSTSGIRVTDMSTENAVDGSLTFFKRKSYEYTYFIKVYNSFDERVEVSVGDESRELLSIEQKLIGEVPGFVVSTKEMEGEGTIVVRSVSQPEICKEIPFKVVTPHVDELYVAYDDENNDGVRTLLTGRNVEATLTVGRSQKVGVTFKTDIEGVDVPENSEVNVTSENAQVTLGNVAYNPDGTIVFEVTASEGAYEGERVSVKVTSADNP